MAGHKIYKYALQRAYTQGLLCPLYIVEIYIFLFYVTYFFIDKEIILTILDNGGISPDKVEEIQVKKENQSEHGFGILIVKKIIALHGGDFKMFYANPGLKTEFRFTVYE